MNDKEKQLLTTSVGARGKNIRAITIADFDFSHFDAVLDIVERIYDFWAYIIHDKDTDTEPHYHLLAYLKGGTSLTTHCSYFEGVLPPNFILKVKNPRSIAKYLIHKGYKDKYQYSVDEVFTNDKGRYISMLDIYTNSGSVWSDFVRVRSGKMSVEDFITRYQSDFSSMPFYQKVSLFQKLYDSGANYSISPHRGRVS